MDYHSHYRVFPGFPGQPGGQFPGTPGGGPSSFPSGQFPGTPGGPGGGQQGGPPSGPPPSFTPQQTSASAFAVDPGAIAGCRFRYTYVWLNNGEQFWFFPTFVGRHSVAGYRWFGYFWAYFGIDTRRIRSFTCF